MPRLVHDVETAEPTPLPRPGQCWQAPQFWTPYSGIPHGGVIIGVKWICALCLLDGQPEFGPAVDAAGMLMRTEVAFYELAQAAGRCPDWQEDEAGEGTARKLSYAEGVAIARRIDAMFPDDDVPAHCPIERSS